MNQEELLEAILQELKNVVEDIRGLRSDLKQLTPNSVKISSTDMVAINSREDDDFVDNNVEEEAFLNILDWLTLRNITVKNYKQQQKADAVFDQLATFLGERFDKLVRLHDQIRKNLSTGNSFTINLSSSNQGEIASATQLCDSLHKYAFLSSYRYNKYTKIIHATPQRVGKVINFFTGGWFERFVFLKIESHLAKNNLNYVYLINPQISMPNGDDFELDIIFLIENEPLWLECKTGDYQSYIKKYSEVRSTLGVPKERSILIVLGISDSLTSQLTNLYDITVANENNFLSCIASVLETPVESNIVLKRTVPSVSIQPAQLLTLLNKVKLRPLPEHRSEVLLQLIDVVRAVDTPKALAEVKSLLSKRVDISNSKLQDILNAVAKSDCLLDERGEVVASFSTPFVNLVSYDVDQLDQRCLESYAQAILNVDPAYFERESNGTEFERITGGKIFEVGIERLKEKLEHQTQRPV